MPASRLLTAFVVAMSIVSGVGLISVETPVAGDVPIAAGTASVDAVGSDADVATPPKASGEASVEGPSG